MRSLSRTLAVRFSATLFVALLLIALWAYLGAQRILRGELDRDLGVSAQLESAVLATGQPLPFHPDAWDFEQYVESVNRFVVVRDMNGTLIARNTPLADDLPIDNESFQQAVAGDSAWTNQRWRGHQIRSLYSPVPSIRTDSAVMQVSASLDPQRAASRVMLLLMLGTVLLGTAATAIGAGWLAGSAVAPVDEITEQANTIMPGTVGQRITAHADVAEFNGLLTVLNGMLDRLDQGLEAQRRIIANVGHDLRTPITAMRGELEVTLRAKRSDQEYRAVLESVLEEVDHLGSISEALVLLARLETGELVPKFQPVDITNLVVTAVQRARGRISERTIECETPAQTVIADADQVMLTVMVDHLLDNIEKHTPTGTTARVSVRSSGQHVTMIVEDDGPGLPRDVSSHLFERFYRADSARTRLGGAGLGLTIAAAIAAAHGGSISGDGSSLGGLRVELKLPRRHGS